MMAKRSMTMQRMQACAGLALLALGLGLGLAPQRAAAQPTVPTWREIVVYASDASYPALLAQRGVQGEATIELALDANGRAQAASVRESSRSAELDALALAMAKRLDIAVAPGAPRSGLVTYRFRKDHGTTIATKSCADFNADAAWQAATFPERNIREMPALVEGIGMLVYSLHRDDSPRKAFPGVEAVVNATVAACARTPEAGMLDVMRQEALKLIDK